MSATETREDALRKIVTEGVWWLYAVKDGYLDAGLSEEEASGIVIDAATSLFFSTLVNQGVSAEDTIRMLEGLARRHRDGDVPPNELVTKGAL